ncbi:hypothetical protein DICVIV_12058 [Dictyocaulus viviparus]|uniref:Protein kinase domain-containing protein n=1 Tax=Dictyocaulus viviparus TaxID=29172 RepID=A0A0D8XDX0_DICVI|nr:hypothetical protein DICVIV_12058 [Dictyocaulus viviparus]
MQSIESDLDVECELEICASLKHPHICELHDVIVGDRLIHFIFEFFEGSDICFEIVKRASNGFVYSEAVVSHYIRQLLQALECVHNAGFIHRDIRPHNIVLTRWICRIGVAQFMAPEVSSYDNYGTQQ